MGSIPGFLLVHTVVTRRYLGAGPAGAVLAAPDTITCMVEDARRLVRDDNGREVVSETTIYHQLSDAEIPAESEVDVNGRTTTVIKARRCDGGGLPTPDHWEVNLI